MGDFLERIIGSHAASEGKKLVAPLVVQSAKSFRDSVLKALGRNFSGQDPDLLARAHTMPWLFPDVPELRGNGNVIRAMPTARPRITSQRTPDQTLTI